MVIYGPSLLVHCGCWVRVESERNWVQQHQHSNRKWRRSVSCKFDSVKVSRACSVAVTLLTTATVIACVATAADEPETLSNIPQTLSGECTVPKDCKKARIQKPKSRNAESCTGKCVTTCIRGGEGSPGEGPFNVIRYRTTQHKLNIRFRHMLGWLII